MLEGLKNKTWIYVGVAVFVIALFISLPQTSDAGSHCEAARNRTDGLRVLCLEQQYPKIPLPAVPGIDDIAGNFSLNDIAERVAPFDTINPLSGLIFYFFAFAVSIVGVVAFGAIIYSGVMLMMSGARPQLRMEAKNRLRNVILGIALLLGSVIILNTVNPELSLINAPPVTKGGIFDLAFKADLERDLRKAQEKSFARKCIGDGKGGGHFEKRFVGTLSQVAQIVCADRSVAPTDAMIQNTLTGMVDKTECSEQDVEEIKSIIKSDAGLCGDQGNPPPPIQVVIYEGDDGMEKIVEINEGTVPISLCAWTGSKGTGLVYGEGISSSHVKQLSEEELLDVFRKNLSDALEQCKKYPTRTGCALKDGTTIESFAGQEDAIVQYCYTITGKEHITF